MAEQSDTQGTPYKPLATVAQAGLGPPKGERLALERVKPRAAADSRPLEAESVVEYAECIETLGLLQPLVVDEHDRLLAGGHRFAAIQLLAEREPDERAAVAARLFGEIDEALRHRVAALDWRAYRKYFRGGVPVLRYPLDSEADTAAALAIEVAENEKRIDYTREQICALYDRLVATGRFRVGDGRPKKGQESASIAVSRIVGKSLPTIKRAVLAGTGKRTARAAKTVSNDTVFTRLRIETERLIKRISAWSQKLSEAERAGLVSSAQAQVWRNALAAAIRDPVGIEDENEAVG